MDKGAESRLISWLLVAKADPQHARGLNDVAVNRHGAQTPDGFRDFHANGVRGTQRDHVAEFALLNESDGPGAKTGA